MIQDYGEPQDEEKLARNCPTSRPPSHAEWIDPIVIDAFAAGASILIIALVLLLLL